MDIAFREEINPNGTLNDQLFRNLTGGVMLSHVTVTDRNLQKRCDEVHQEFNQQKHPLTAQSFSVTIVMSESRLPTDSNALLVRDVPNSNCLQQPVAFVRPRRLYNRCLFAFWEHWTSAFPGHYTTANSITSGDSISDL